ncbi:hypothetical protein [uncultured Mailhella sp.]|uniref:hypothetical protein n=1 Tax=uncultured Mailhella sp. TaxID=1981031 RepID=UPI002628F9C8|nr:hypothetical protein [uncultured Mailhella sp.]
MDENNMTNQETATYCQKDELMRIAEEVIEFLRPKGLKFWQIKEITRDMIDVLWKEKLK